LQQIISRAPQHDFRRVLNDLHKDDLLPDAPARKVVSGMSSKELLTLIRMELQRGRGVRNREISGKVLVGFAVIVAIIAVVILLGVLTNGAAFEGCGSGCSGIGQIDLPNKEVRTPELEYLAATLANTQDADSTCMVLEVASMSSFLSDWLFSSLDEKLMQTRAEDAVHWSLVHQRLLLRRLKQGGDPKRSLLALLHALGCVGPKEAIVPVYRLLRDPDSEISAAAEKCCTLLQKRARMAGEERELMRSSSQPPCASEDLLRAGHYSCGSHSSEMLRAAEDASAEERVKIG